MLYIFKLLLLLINIDQETVLNWFGIEDPNIREAIASGYNLNLSNIEPMYKHLTGIDSMPQRPSDVVACMETNQAMREAYWGS